MSATLRLSRRRLLRGAMGGGAVTVGLPLLDCFLDANGTALASGAPLPVCFGTWFFGCGFNPGRWEPKETGKIGALGPELAPLAGYKDRMNVFSGYSAFLDGKPNITHVSGPAAIITGDVPATGGPTHPSVDALVADAIGANTRFRSLEVACTGNPNLSMSRRSGATVNPSEVSPLALYTRVFGPEFTDPNAADFTPDPAVMVRRSVLSAVGEQSKGFLKQVGAADRAHLDEYFTSLRELEKQLDLQLQKPAPLEACSVPAKPGDAPVGTLVQQALDNHKLFSGILAHALACGQTRVVNVAFTEGLSSLRLPGEANTHHLFTHDEAVDEKLGYQPNVTKFTELIMGGFKTLLDTLNGVREGDRTLLDRTLVLLSTDSGFAKIHTLDNIAMITVGGAGGRIKTGLHAPATKGDSVTRVGLTIQQAFGVSVGAWGTGSNQTSKAITEIMA